MNENERGFRKRVAPVLRSLAELCRGNDSAFVAVIEVEPGKMIQVSYLPEGTQLKHLPPLAQYSEVRGHC